MICISVTPQSRKLAKADLLNASRQGDLIELCLDRLIKAPDMAELLEGINKPILVSCRTPADGGHYEGTDEQRMTLLREAIVAEPAYIELDLETAKKVPRYGTTKRVVSYTSLDKPLGKVDDIFEEAYKAKADIVKFTWPTPTLDAAWPLLAAVTQKREVPVVGMGLGRAGLTFSLLGLKYGSPWVYAALEKGMEAYEGQPTVSELDETFCKSDIDAQTKFVGIAGLGAAQFSTIKILNQAFKQFDLKHRCLPLAIGKFDNVAKMLDVLKVNAILSSPKLGEHIFPLAEKLEEASEAAHYADLLLKQPEGWTGYNSLWRSALKSLETKLGSTGKDDRPLDRKNVLVIGHGGLARTIVHGIQQRKGLISITSGKDKEAMKIAQEFGLRHVGFGNLYDTLVDVVVIADPNLTIGHKKEDFNASYFKPGMTVMDVSNLPEESAILDEAKYRGAKIVEPLNVYADQLATQFKSITGKGLPEGLVEQVLGSTE